MRTTCIASCICFLFFTLGALHLVRGKKLGSGSIGALEWFYYMSYYPWFHLVSYRTKICHIDKMIEMMCLVIYSYKDKPFMICPMSKSLVGNIYHMWCNHHPRTSTPITMCCWRLSRSLWIWRMQHVEMIGMDPTQTGLLYRLTDTLDDNTGYQALLLITIIRISTMLPSFVLNAINEPRKKHANNTHTSLVLHWQLLLLLNGFSALE